MITKKLILTCWLATGALLTLPAHALEKVRLAQNVAPISGMSIVAKAQGFFEEQGLDVSVINVTSGRQAMEAVLAGGADLATTAESPITAAAFAGQPVAVLARTEYSDLKTLVSSASGINTPKDLRSKRIGYTAGSGSEVYTWTLLKQAGLTAKDVTLVNLRPQDMVAATAAGSIDAYNIWEPYISNGKRVLGDKAKALDTRGVYSETFNIVTLQKYLGSNPKVAESFLKALLEAQDWMKAHPDEAITLVAKTVGMTPEELKAIWGDYVFNLTLDQRVLDILDAHAHWRLETGNAAGNPAHIPDFNSFIFSAPLKQVAPERVTLEARN